MTVLIHDSPLSPHSSHQHSVPTHVPELVIPLLTGYRSILFPQNRWPRLIICIDLFLMGEGGVDVSFQMQSILYDTVVAVDFSYFILCTSSISMFKVFV